jgi:hypothetical protein
MRAKSRRRPGPFRVGRRWHGVPRVGHLYGYRLEPGTDGTTTVTSYCDWSGVNDEWKQSGFFPVTKATTLRATLGILERLVRTGY